MEIMQNKLHIILVFEMSSDLVACAAVTTATTAEPVNNGSAEKVEK